MRFHIFSLFVILIKRSDSTCNLHVTFVFESYSLIFQNAGFFFAEFSEHTFSDCDFSFNTNGGMFYKKSGFNFNKHKISIDRCHFTNNDASGYFKDQNIPGYALSLNIHDSDFEIRNCVIENNVRLGGIGVIIGDSNTKETKEQVGCIGNNQLKGNIQGSGMINISRITTHTSQATLQYVTINGNSITNNSVFAASTSIIYISDTHCDLNFNIPVYNTRGKVISFNQGSDVSVTQNCKYNVIANNTCYDSDENVTIKTIANGTRFMHNVIHNPANEHEI